jgi:hypothetical protein
MSSQGGDSVALSSPPSESPTLSLSSNVEEPTNNPAAAPRRETPPTPYSTGSLDPENQIDWQSISIQQTESYRAQNIVIASLRATIETQDIAIASLRAKIETQGKTLENQSNTIKTLTKMLEKTQANEVRNLVKNFPARQKKYPLSKKNSGHGPVGQKKYQILAIYYKNAIKIKKFIDNPNDERLKKYCL